MAINSIVVRIYYKDWKKIRSEFKAERGERLVDYFTRLAKFLEDLERGA